MELAPELQTMLERMRELQRQVHAQQLPPDQAQAILESLVAFDAHGHPWKIALGAGGAPVFVTGPLDGSPAPADPLTFERPQPTSKMFATPEEPSDLLTPPKVPLGSIYDGLTPEQVANLGGDPASLGNQGNATATGDIPRFGLEKNLKPSRFKNLKEKTAPLVGRVAALVAPHKRLVVIAAICAVGLLVVLAVQRGGEPSQPSQEQQAADCGPLPEGVVGVVTEERQRLAACLSTVPGFDPSVLSAVLDPTGRFAPNAKVTRQGILFGLGNLFTVTNAPRPDLKETDLSGVNPLLQEGVQLAVDVGVVSPDNIDPDKEATRGQAAQFIARLLRATTTSLPTDNTPASDAPEGDASTDQALLAALGISDTPPGAPYGFATPLTAVAYVDMLGKTYEYLTQGGGLTTTGGQLPDAGTVSAVTDMLVTGDMASAATLVDTQLEESQVALALAPYAGASTVGLQITVSTPVERDGNPISTATFTSGPEVVASSEIQWVLVDGKWKIQIPPAPSR